MMMPEMLTYPQRTSPRKKSSKWHGPLPVSAIEKVLIQDNRFADSLLTKQLSRIRTDKYRAERLLDWQEQSFVLRQAIKETELREMGISHTSFLPEIVMKMTEPDVRARRPFGRVRRSATDLELAADKKDKKTKLLPSLTDRQTRDSRRTASTDMSDPFLENAKDKRIFTRLHGIDLPLYGPHEEAKREKRERDFVHHLQRQQTKAKVTLDPRFRQLEKTLVRSETNLLLLAGLPQVSRGPKTRENTTVVAKATRTRREGRMPTKSAKVVSKMQEELSQKPKSVFAKSAWIDFS